jgi:hypothetical protein
MTDPKIPLEAHRFLQRASIARFAGDGATVVFFLPVKPRRLEDIDVYKAGVWLEPDDRGTAYGYAWDGDRKITLHAAPGVGVRLILKVQGPV